MKRREFIAGLAGAVALPVDGVGATDELAPDRRADVIC